MIKKAMDQIQAVFGNSNVPPEKLAEAFSESLSDGTTNIFKEGYTIESVNKVVKKMVSEIKKDLEQNPLRERPFKNVDELQQQVLLDKAKGMSMKQLKKKYGKSLNQLNLDL